MTTSRFCEWFAFGALACWMGLGLMRALMLRARGVPVFVVDRQRTGGQMLADTVMFACLLAFGYEIIAYAWQLRFHIGPSVLERSVVDGPASQALGALIVTGAVILYVIALRDLGVSWRLGLDRSAPGPLVTGGVYRWTRHPIYIAFDLWFMGTFLLIGRLSFLVLALVCVPLLHAIMDREERFLTRLYGDAYRDYSRRVGRYFFRQRHE
ncbi:MAG: isoprenylcysteine carboxylmethyltransferase family protein [Verrucomicrobia bacterium]|nr:isoprenylcysteine carboxylmethyltransferase family protein [Verrucomicrobiota bacterium]